MSNPKGGHPYYLVDVFTDRVFGGNPLAVFPDALRIAPEIMPKIAAELNLSEVAFVLPKADSSHSLQLKIFTPRMELPFAGHPTVGAACALVAEGHLRLDGDRGEFVFMEGVGKIRVVVERDSRGLTARFSVAKLPEFGPEPPSIDSLSEMLGVGIRDVASGERRPRAVSCGVPYLFVELETAKALARVEVNLTVWKEVLENYWAPHVYVVVRLSDSLLRARMFAPAMGIAEDPATGAAASALAGYLDRPSFGDGARTWTVEQGIEMGRPSRIEVTAERQDGGLQTIQVGGRSVLVGRGLLLDGVS